MKINLLVRNWHINLGTILAVPVFVVCVTAILMAHNQTLDLRSIPMNLAWLPGYQNANKNVSDMEVRSTLHTSDNRYYIGTRFGLWELKDNRLVQIPEAPEGEIRSIKETPQGMILAGRYGVWMSEAGHWKKLYRGDAWEVETLPNQHLRIATRKKGFMESDDQGKHWHPVKELNSLPYVVPNSAVQEEMNLGRLVLDLHTGRAWFGKQWAWLWIDIIAAILALLVMSGLWLKGWTVSRKRSVQ